MSKTIEPYLERGRQIVAKGTTNLTELAKGMINPEAPDEEQAVVPFPGAPKPVVITDDHRKALAEIGDVFGLVQPEKRRALTLKEREQVYREQQVLKVVLELMATRQEDLKEIVRNDMDVTAEKKGVAHPNDTTEDQATERDDKGHYILAKPQQPERLHIPGTNQEWSREFRSGGIGIAANLGTVEQMVEDGEISRKAYLAVSEERRVWSEGKAMLALAKPDLRDDVIKIVRAMTFVKKPGTSLFTRKKKD